MKFKKIFNELNENEKIKVSVESKGKFYNYVYGWENKEIKRGKGYPITLNVKLPIDIKLFWMGDVYEEYTGRKVVNINDESKLEILFNEFEFLKRLNDKKYWVKWYEDIKMLNKKELNIEGNIQEIKVEKKISPEKMELLNLKSEILNELEDNLKIKNVYMEKENKFNVVFRNRVKRVNGYILKSNKFLNEYFISLQFDRTRNYKVVISLYEKKTGLLASEFFGISHFIDNLNRIFEMDKKLNVKDNKRVN